MLLMRMPTQAQPWVDMRLTRMVERQHMVAAHLVVSQPDQIISERPVQRLTCSNGLSAVGGASIVALAAHTGCATLLTKLRDALIALNDTAETTTGLLNKNAVVADCCTRKIEWKLRPARLWAARQDVP